MDIDAIKDLVVGIADLVELKSPIPPWGLVIEGTSLIAKLGIIAKHPHEDRLVLIPMERVSKIHIGA